MQSKDPALSPSHYSRFKYQPIKVIADWGLNFNLGCVVKYLVRAKHKGAELQDLEKAYTYLGEEIARMKAVESIEVEVAKEALPYDQRHVKGPECTHRGHAYSPTKKAYYCGCGYVFGQEKKLK